MTVVEIFFFIIITVIIYVSGIYVEISTCTIKDVEYHEGGFLNMGFTTHNNRELEPKDVRKALLGPIFFIILFIKSIIWITNDTMCVVLLVTGFKYKNTRVYKWIERLVKD